MRGYQVAFKKVSPISVYFKYCFFAVETMAIKEGTTLTCGPTWLGG